MSKKKILIWSVGISVLLNVFVINKITFRSSPSECPPPPDYLEVFYLEQPICSSAGWPIRYLFNNSPYSGLYSALNILFWFVTIYLIFLLINRIKIKNQVRGAKF